MLLRAASAMMFEIFIILVGCAMTFLNLMMLTIGFELTTYRDRGVLLEAASLRQRPRGSLFCYCLRLTHKVSSWARTMRSM